MSTAFRISMDGAQQVPSIVSAATAFGTAVYDSNTHTLEYLIFVSGVDFGNFVGITPQTATTADDVNDAHFHAEARGANGAVVFGWLSHDADDFGVALLGDGSWLVAGEWELTDVLATPLSSFEATLAAATVGADIPLYANIHTVAYAGGEIRGQLVGLATDAGQTINGTAGNDILPGLGGNDVITGMGGNDILEGGAGEDNLDGGAGFDIVSYTSAGSGISAFLNAQLGAGLGGDATGDLYSGIEGVIGSDFADVLAGNDPSVLFVVPNAMQGGAGDDIIYGEGIDMVSGGEGNDVLFGGGGGMVTLDLGAASIETVWGSVVGDALDGLTATNALSIIGQGGGDFMRGGSGADFLYFDHLDTVNGGARNDWAVATLSSQGVNLDLNVTAFENTWGSPFNDILTGAGAAATVVIVGDLGNDAITGGNSFDFLYGFGDNDTLTGGPGGDVMLGGAGSDNYAYINPTDGFDSIFDFDTGVDKFQFTGASFGKAPGALLDGTNFKSGAAPASTNPTPPWLYNTGTGILTFDADGIGAAAPVSLAQIFLAPAVAAGDIAFV